MKDFLQICLSMSYFSSRETHFIFNAYVSPLEVLIIFF